MNPKERDQVSRDAPGGVSFQDRLASGKEELFSMSGMMGQERGCALSEAGQSGPGLYTRMGVVFNDCL